MEKQWMLAYPKEGEWLSITDLLVAGEILEYVQSHFITHRVKAYTRYKEEFRSWVINSSERIRTFYWYLRNTLGTGELKVRIKIREY